MTFSAKHVNNERKANNRSPLAPILGGLALPIAFAWLFVGAGLGGYLNVAMGIVVFVAVYAYAYMLAGGRGARVLLIPILVVMAAGIAMAGEFLLVIYSAGLAWVVLIPLGIWVSYVMAKSINPVNYQPAALAPPHAPRPPVLDWPENPQQPMSPPSSPPTHPGGAPQQPIEPDSDFWKPKSRDDDDTPGFSS